MAPRIQKFITAISFPTCTSRLNDLKYVLAPKDMHFANIMYDPTDPNMRITAVLHWNSPVSSRTALESTSSLLVNTKWTPGTKEDQTKPKKLF